MIQLSESEEKPLLLWEVIKILEKRRGKSSHWDKTDHRKVYEYANRFIKLEFDDALELLNLLTGKFKLPRIVAVQFVDILPITIEELEPFFEEIQRVSESIKTRNKEELPQYLREVLEFSDKLEEMDKDAREEFIRNLIEVFREYWKKARKIVTIEEEKKE